MLSRAAITPYSELAPLLATRFDSGGELIDLRADGIAAVIHAISTSSGAEFHPAQDVAHGNATVRALVSFFLENNPFSRRHFMRELDSPDRDVAENREFRYWVVAPDRVSGESGGRADRGTLLLHGLNEKSWHKYLPWAVRIAEHTGRPVLLYPIAFHMNRAPQAWANPREMMGVAKERRRLFPELVAGSFANAALSHRIQFAPHRFLTSGLETYANLVDLAGDIRDGTHALFEKGATLDLFGYSIGAALAELLLMANREGLFSRSRAFLFCGGSLLDQANPVSRAIMDDQAHQALVRYLETFASDPTSALPLRQEEVDAMSREIEVIRSTLFMDARRDTREWIMGNVGDRISALMMARDEVFHPDGMTASWAKGRTPLFDISVVDPPYRYSHESPFPTRGGAGESVDEFFEDVMRRAADALGS